MQKLLNQSNTKNTLKEKVQLTLWLLTFISITFLKETCTENYKNIHKIEK